MLELVNDYPVPRLVDYPLSKLPVFRLGVKSSSPADRPGLSWQTGSMLDWTGRQLSTT